VPDWLGKYSKDKDIMSEGPTVVGMELPYNRELKKEIKRVETGYCPRPLQALIHASLKRFNVLVCHRRFGKTILLINETINRGLKNQLHNPQYAYVAPTYKQAKMIAWEYIVDYTSSLPGVKVNKSELSVEILREGTKDANGAWLKKPDKIKFMLLGADNPDSLRGIYLDGAGLDEFAQCDPIIWGEIIRPALADRKGWAIFIGTPKGQNHFYNRLKKAETQPENWFTAIYKASETGVLPTEELEDMMSDMEPEEIEQELECSFHAAVRGSYYGDALREIEENGQIRRVFHNPKYPVDTHWDIGIGDSTAIVFRQKINDTWHYIDYLEANGKGVEWYIDELEKKPYVYGRHVWPHDGKNKDFITGQSRVEVVRELKPGWEWHILTKQGLDDGIQAARRRLKTSVFDSVKCVRLLDCLKNYQREWDSKLMLFRDKPKHDWASHGADAYRYDALDEIDSRELKKRRDSLPRMADSDYNELEY